VVLDDVPYDGDIRLVVSVAQPITKVIHLAPIDICFMLLDIVRKLSRRLADDFRKTLSRHSAYFIYGELLMAAACQHLVDLGDGFKNIPQPVFSGGRHSEHLDQIVGDPFRDAWLQQVTHRYLGLKTRRILNQMHDLEQVERR
jgi:hypothetical protein